jgi:hypothetical protein
MNSFKRYLIDAKREGGAATSSGSIADAGGQPTSLMLGR